MAKTNSMPGRGSLYRSATITQSYYPARNRRNGRTPEQHVPWLTLRGLWLKQAGFDVGQAYSIHVAYQRLIIVPVKPKEAPRNLTD